MTCPMTIERGKLHGAPGQVRGGAHAQGMRSSSSSVGTSLDLLERMFVQSLRVKWPLRSIASTLWRFRTIPKIVRDGTRNILQGDTVRSLTE